MCVADFLDLASRTPFAWGRFDCGLWLADWLIMQGADDPAADLRGRYTTIGGCRRVLNRAGGMASVIAGCADRAGLERTDRPIAGDVGVVEVVSPTGKREQAGAICTGPRWAVLGVTGLIVAPMTPVAAWSIACRRP